MKKLFISFCLLWCLIGQSSTMGKILIGDDSKTVKNRFYPLTVADEAPGGSRVTFRGNPDLQANITNAFFDNDHLYSIEIKLSKAMTLEEVKSILNDLTGWIITMDKKGSVMLNRPPTPVMDKNKRKPSFNKEKPL